MVSESFWMLSSINAMNVVANVNWCELMKVTIKFWHPMAIRFCKGGYNGLNSHQQSVTLVTSQVVNCRQFWPNLMVWNKPRWLNDPFLAKKNAKFHQNKKHSYWEEKEGATKECHKMIKDFIAREMKRHVDCVTTALNIETNRKHNKNI
jgi:hypothetical protein